MSRLSVISMAACVAVLLSRRRLCAATGIATAAATCLWCTNYARTGKGCDCRRHGRKQEERLESCFRCRRWRR